MTIERLKTKPLETTDDAISTSAAVIDTLRQVLKDTYCLVLKSQVYHWNVTGPMFVPLHNLTEAQYTNMFAAVDELAERIRALGAPAELDPSRLAAGTKVRNAEVSFTAVEMVNDLCSDHERLVSGMRQLVQAAETAADTVTADLATERAAFHEKAAWMFRSMAA